MPPAHDSNYDEPWKAFIKNHFQAFLQSFFPDIAAFIDWSEAQEFDPTEISQFLGKAKTRNRFADVVVKAKSLDGRVQILLLHVEIQTKYSSGLSRRLFKLNCGLEWQFQEADVISLVVRTDQAKKWQPSQYQLEMGSFFRSIKFPTCKLSEKLETDWKDDESLPVMVARAQMEALKTRSDATARYEAKKELIRQLYQGEYSRDEVLEILRYVDWMLHLCEDLEVKLREDIYQFASEKYKDMTEYLTSWERIAKSEGKAEGIAEGKAEGEAQGKHEEALRLVMILLERGCGEIPENLQHKVEKLSLGSLEELFQASLKFTSVDDLSQWMVDNAG